MARVSFNNARIEFITDGAQSGYGNRTYSTTYGKPLGAYGELVASLNTYDIDSVATYGKAIMVDTPTKWVCNYSGTFTKSGSVIYIAVAYTQGVRYWGVLKITNISFSEGDEFDFDIEITYSGD